MKKCTKCRRSLGLDAFRWKRNRDANERSSRCRECLRAEEAARRATIEREPAPGFDDEGFAMSIPSIARELGISKQRVSKLLNRAYAKIRDAGSLDEFAGWRAVRW